jgi:hypothetical protein
LRQRLGRCRRFPRSGWCALRCAVLPAVSAWYRGVSPAVLLCCVLRCAFRFAVLRVAPSIVRHGVTRCTRCSVVRSDAMRRVTLRGFVALCSLRKCPLGPEGDVVVQALSRRCTTLEVLDMTACGLTDLCPRIALLPRLSSVALTDNPIGSPTGLSSSWPWHVARSYLLVSACVGGCGAFSMLLRRHALHHSVAPRACVLGSPLTRRTLHSPAVPSTHPPYPPLTRRTLRAVVPCGALVPSCLTRRCRAHRVVCGRCCLASLLSRVAAVSRRWCLSLL